MKNISLCWTLLSFCLALGNTSLILWFPIITSTLAACIILLQPRRIVRLWNSSWRILLLLGWSVWSSLLRHIDKTMFWYSVIITYCKWIFVILRVPPRHNWNYEMKDKIIWVVLTNILNGSAGYTVQSPLGTGVYILFISEVVLNSIWECSSIIEWLHLVLFYFILFYFISPTIYNFWNRLLSRGITGNQ